LNSPFSILRSATKGIKKPNVIASINGGHFLTVMRSLFEVELKFCCGKALNQLGSPRSAGIGFGRTCSISGGHENFTVSWFAWFIVGSSRICGVKTLQFNAWRTARTDISLRENKRAGCARLYPRYHPQ